ncbi:MAG TPA: HAD family acid phosphatase [Xanthobacteraceae bacterium]|nr:HAD family acid phosphatase [Xanthobacteraceae bacterium]
MVGTDCRRIKRSAVQLILIMLAALLAGGAVAEPINLGDVNPQDTAFIAALKPQEIAYYHNGYQQDLAAVGAAAQDWLRWRAPYVAKPALVLDIDETSLSNWPEILANDFAYIRNGPCRLPQGPCGVLAWDRMSRAKAIVPTLDLFKVAISIGVAVFFITGRHDMERAATARNLHIAGYVDKFGRNGWSGLMMEPNGAQFASAADFKAPERAKIEAMGYWIIENMGDQPSDLAGGYAERTFKLPNPFYRIP